MVEDIEQVATNLYAINLYLKKGEYVPPLLPQKEGDKVRAENATAMTVFGGHIIATLLNPKVAELALQDDKWSSVYLYQPCEVVFNIQNGQPNLILRWKDQQGAYPFREESFAAFQDEALKWNPPAREKWAFETEIYTSSTTLYRNLKYYRFRAQKNLEPSDVAVSVEFFQAFLSGSKDYLQRALRKINSQTIPEDEAEKLRRITEACLQGSSLVENALRS